MSDQKDDKSGRDFSEAEIKSMQDLIMANSNVVQVEHCLHQLIRFANLAINGKEFRELQLGFNLGRVQELLMPGNSAAVACWWRRYEPLVLGKRYKAVIELTEKIIGQLKLSKPTEQFINKE
jgi:hypothetical protein